MWAKLAGDQVLRYPPREHAARLATPRFGHQRSVEKLTLDLALALTCHRLHLVTVEHGPPPRIVTVNVARLCDRNGHNPVAVPVV